MKLGKTHFNRMRCSSIAFKNKITLDRYLELRKAFGFNGYIRRGSFVDELISDYRKLIFPRPNFSPKSIWIYRYVLNDVKSFIANNKLPRLKKPKPAVLWNKEIGDFKGKMTATDIDHAYWKIAFIKGYICEKTYLKGLEIEDKSLRNSALANLTSSKEWFLLRDGEITKKSFVILKDDSYSIIYNDIRFSCYKLMNDLSLLLKSDFICYKTDCIYYVDNKKNRKLVQDFLSKNQMDWKQLEENINNHKKQKHEKSTPSN